MVVKHLSNAYSLTSLHPNRISAFSWDTQRKLWGIISTTNLRAKCLLLGMEFFLEKEFLKGEKSGRTVQLEEVRDEPIGSDSTSDANVAKQVEVPMGRDAPPQPRRSTRLRQVRELLLLDNDEPATYAEAMVGPDSVKC